MRPSALTSTNVAGSVLAKMRRTTSSAVNFGLAVANCQSLAIGLPVTGASVKKKDAKQVFWKIGLARANMFRS